MKFLRFIQHRLCERSTISDIAAASVAAAALPWPWNLVCFAALAGKAFIPDGLVAERAK